MAEALQQQSAGRIGLMVGILTFLDEGRSGCWFRGSFHSDVNMMNPASVVTIGSPSSLKTNIFEWYLRSVRQILSFVETDHFKNKSYSNQCKAGIANRKRLMCFG
jgi:hypothetical protein